MERTVSLPESYLPYSSHSLNGIRLHEFQYKIKDVGCISEDCLVVQAPTGSGKTFAFLLPLIGDFSARIDTPKVIIIAPTNSLAHEIYDNVSKPDSRSVVGREIRADIWTAHTLGPWKSRTQDVVDSLDSNDVIVSNPDIISLLVSGFYLLKDDPRAKQWSRIFRKISVMIIDEFHCYPEEEIAKILSFIILAKGTGNTHVKYIFTSATPNEKLQRLLTDFGISFTWYKEDSVAKSPQEGGRKFRGKLSITFTDENILNSVDKVLSADGKDRVLFLTDHVVDAERIIDKIMRTVPGEPIWEITGVATRSKNRKEPTERERYVVATNAAEHGLNMKVSLAHIEPGLYIENFRQRFGRIARGEPGELFVHTTTEILKQLPDSVSSETELFSKLEELIPKKDFYSTSVKRVVSAYLYLVYKSARLQLKEQVRNIMVKNTLSRGFEEFDSLVDEFEKKAGNVLAREEIDCLGKWWNSYLRAYGFFRGQSINVNVKLPRIDEKESVFDIVWLERNTDYEAPEDKSNQPYRVVRYLEDPRKVFLHYQFCGKFKVDEKEFRDPSRLREKWEEKIVSFFDDHRRGISRDKELGHIVEEIKKLLPSVLCPMYSNLLPPEEVGAVENDLFL